MLALAFFGRLALDSLNCRAHRNRLRGCKILAAGVFVALGDEQPFPLSLVPPVHL